MQTMRDLAIQIILVIMGIWLIGVNLYFGKWFWIIIGILDLLVSVPYIIKYFINKNKK